MMNSDIKNIAYITVKGDDYCCIIYGVSKSNAIHLLENYVLNNIRFIPNAFQRSQN